MKQPIPPSDLLRRYLSGKCSADERAMVNEWYQNLNTGVDDHFTFADEQNLYQTIRERIEDQQEAAPQSNLFRTYVARIAAVICIALGIVYYFRVKNDVPAKQEVAVKESTIFTNTSRRIAHYRLPDSTQVWLHPGAEISFLNEFKKREVTFSGDGFFDVTPDKSNPFVIISGELRTKVLGTSFHVKACAAKHAYEVTVVTGLVEVGTLDEDQSVVLRPRQQMVFGKKDNLLNVKTLQETEKRREIWQPVSLEFEETPMSEVAAKLSDAFRVKIDFENPNIRKCLLKVDFNNQHLPEVLDMIDALLGTTYQMEGDTITISGEGCE